jgi:uncharacterized protein YdeI (YjbR/CyaY-like superfamily)
MKVLSAAPNLSRAQAENLRLLAQALWSDITPNARRDWIHWITSAKQEETPTRRIKNACSMCDRKVGSRKG